MAFLLTTFRANAQPAPPTTPLLRVSYDEKVVTFSQLDSFTLSEQLNGLERLKFRRSEEVFHVDGYIDLNNQPIAFITDNTVRNDAQKLPHPKHIVVTPQAVSFYDGNWQLFFSQDNPTELKQSMVILSALMSQLESFSFPATDKAAEIAQRLTEQGYSVSLSGGGVVTGTTGQRTVVYDLARRLTQTRVDRENQNWLSEQTVYGALSSGEDVPTLRETVISEALVSGGCIRRVRQSHFSNYQIVRESGERTQNMGNQGFEAEPGTKLIPNPASNFVEIKLPQTKSNTAEIQVINSAGILVQATSWSLYSDTSIRLDVSNLFPGAYWVRILLAEKVETLRFVKI
ncbi:MAG: T9SS type A sorting domain-containing protein [Saprospiraceae bacterium]|nr:T9SS type A sorting domain-containing protein [Saprospiraceae bacterium]